jgi:hypothetical protein
MSTVSTNNDEIIFLIYADNGNMVIPELFYQEYFVFDSLIHEKTFEFSNPCSDSTEFTFVLIEIDTRRTIQQIEPVVRLNLNKLLSAYNNGNQKTIIEYLGKEDLLGIDKISCNNIKNENPKIVFSGVHLFDTYNYVLILREF